MTVNELNSRCVEIHTGLEMEIHDAQKDIDFLKEENIKQNRRSVHFCGTMVILYVF